MELVICLAEGTGVSGVFSFIIGNIRTLYVSSEISLVTLRHNFQQAIVVLFTQHPSKFTKA